jgi:hypothetical protein
VSVLPDLRAFGENQGENMKNRKQISLAVTMVILSVIIIAFAPAACNTDGGNGGGGGSSGDVNGIKITEPVTGAPEDETDFSFIRGRHITYYIPDSSVTVSGKNVSMNLGVPKSEYLETVSKLSLDYMSGGTGVIIVNPTNPTYPIVTDDVTISPNDAKIFTIESFRTYDYSEGSNYSAGLLYCSKDYYNNAYLIYSNKDVTIKGTYTVTYSSTSVSTIKYDISLKAGWNYLYQTDDGTSTSSTSIPAYFKWRVIINK